MNWKRLLAGIIVIAIVIAGVRLAMGSTPILGYRLLDDYNLAVQVIGSQAQWRDVTVEETATTVKVDLKEIWIHGPGFDDAIAYVAIRLREPLGARTVVDAASGTRVPLVSP